MRQTPRSIQTTFSTDEQRPTSVIGRAMAQFHAGEPVLVYDAADRESETDIIYPARSVTPRAITRLRNDAGGLVCVALSNEVCEQFALPFAQEEIDHPSARDHALTYDDRSSFSLSVNHRDTGTGIDDNDRARTIVALGDAATNPETTEFEDEFRCPGHVQLLRGAPNLIADRRGHTELGLTLARAAGREPAVVVCEMLDDETGAACSRSDALRYAERNRLAFIDGARLVEELPRVVGGGKQTSYAPLRDSARPRSTSPL
jgi:3,4-dihydroxy 2-butanone 4-phosphate synthase